MGSQAVGKTQVNRGQSLKTQGIQDKISPINRLFLTIHFEELLNIILQINHFRWVQHMQELYNKIIHRMFKQIKEQVRRAKPKAANSWARTQASMLILRLVIPKTSSSQGVIIRVLQLMEALKLLNMRILSQQSKQSHYAQVPTHHL